MKQMRAVQISEYGGPEQLCLNTVAVPQPRQGEVLVRMAYAGVNFMDIYTRRGVYRDSSPYVSELPLTLGMEGSGWVEAIGEDVTDFEVGNRVVFCLSRGSYADFAVVAADKLLLLPDVVSLELAAAAFFQGLTAHYLAYDASRAQPGDICLVYSAAGGVAQQLIQLLRHRKVNVIAVASAIDKCVAATSAGANRITLNQPQSILDTVAEYTNGQGVDVLFDSVGIDLFDTSLKVLRKKGLFLHYGANSGALGRIDPMRLANAGSLYFVRPRLHDYIATRVALAQRANHLFDLWTTLEPNMAPGAVFDLTTVGAGHHALETRRSVGKSIVRIAA